VAKMPAKMLISMAAASNREMRFLLFVVFMLRFLLKYRFGFSVLGGTGFLASSLILYALAQNNILGNEQLFILYDITCCVSLQYLLRKTGGPLPSQKHKKERPSVGGASIILGR